MQRTSVSPSAPLAATLSRMHASPRGGCNPRRLRAVSAAGALLLTCGTISVPAVVAAQWNPAAFAAEDTLELRTIGPQEGEHWFPVWLVVLDGQVYVRLGSRAARRVERNTAAPALGVRVAGQHFDRVAGVPAPDDAERVAAAIADKYWSDIFIRWFPHPLTLRLVPPD